MDKALRDRVTQKRAGTKLDWRRKMSDHVAYGLLVYTGLQIFVTMSVLKVGAGSILPYFALICYATPWLALVPKLPAIRHTDLSYGLYLYGWPVAQLVQLHSPGGALHNAFWATLPAFALAAGSWFLVERPALRLKKRFVARAPDASPVAGETGSE